MIPLRAEITDKRNGPMTWTAQWNKEGWTFSNSYHQGIMTKPDGSMKGAGPWDFEHMLLNEQATGPSNSASFLHQLWQDINDNKLGPERALERWEQFCGWITETTRSEPSDDKLYD